MLHNWVRSINGFSNENPLTHTRMSGGRFYIPECEYEEFQRIYSQDFDNGIKNTLSEIKSDHAFKLFFDIDMLDFKEASNEYILKIADIIQKEVNKYFNNSEDLMYVVATTQSKKINKDEVEYIKTGVHIIYPNLFVSKDMAIQIRCTTVIQLKVEFGEREIKSNPWGDVIDSAPYSNGLKLCGSVKVVKCEDCREKKENEKEELKEIVTYRKKKFPRKKEDEFNYSDLDDLSRDEFRDEYFSELIFKYTNNNICDVCNGTKKILEDRYYMPEYVIQNDGSISEYNTNLLKNSTFEAVKMTSIRCKSDELCTENFKKPIGMKTAPRTSIGKLSTRLKNSSLSAELRNSTMFTDDAESIVTWKGNTVEDPKIIEAIQFMIRNFDDKYKDILVKCVVEVLTKKIEKNKFSNITHTPENIVKHIPSYKVTVDGNGSNYCINKLGYHTSCTCYFMVSQKGIKQLCFSKKDVLRKGGNVVCKDFSSVIKRLPDKLHEILFPGEILKTNTASRIQKLAKKKKGKDMDVSIWKRAKITVQDSHE